MGRTVLVRLSVGLLWASAVVAAFCGTASAVTVSTVGQLYNAVAGSDPDIVINPGTYHLSGGSLNFWRSGVTLRSSTGNYEDVTLWGGGMNNRYGTYEAVQIYADQVTVRDITIEGFFHHAVHFQNSADQALVSNVRTLNIGEQHMKGVKYTVGGEIEHCLMEQTQVRLNGFEPDRPDNYVGGIDLLGATNWNIHDNVAKNIKASDFGYGDAGIFLWQDINNCVIERNVIIGCNKGIALGNPSNSSNIRHADGCIVRNNFVTRGDDIGIELCYTKDCKVYNNTVYGSSTYFRSVHILDKSQVRTQNLQLAYNIIRGNILDNTVAGGYTLTGNILGTGAATSWFVDPTGGDLHLTASATAAIDGAQTLPEVFEDIDAQPRPIGNYPDVGADEYDPNPPPDEPTIEHAVRFLGNGMYGVTFTLCGNDGQQDEFAVTATFEGANGGQVQQQQAILDPGVEEYDVDTEADAASYDGLGTPPYDKDRDSYFLEPFALSGSFLCSEGANYYQVSSDTGGVVGEQAALAYIVCTGDVSFLSLVGRGGEIYTPSGLVEMPLPGDADRNGQVDGADYTTWADNYQQTDKGWSGADFNGDGVVDGGDYTIWADYFTGGGAAVPEPMTLGLLIAAGGALVAPRRRR